MPFHFFFWNSEIIEHLAEHDVSPDEFEQVVCHPHSTGKSRSSGLPTAEATISGRRLFCVYRVMDDDTIFPVTAYEIE